MWGHVAPNRGFGEEHRRARQQGRDLHLAHDLSMCRSKQVRDDISVVCDAQRLINFVAYT